jgi:hypothetical protein
LPQLPAMSRTDARGEGVNIVVRISGSQRQSWLSGRGSGRPRRLRRV